MKTFLYILVTFLFVGSIFCGLSDIIPIKRMLGNTMSCPPTAEEMARAVPMPFPVIDNSTGRIGLRATVPCNGQYSSELKTGISYYESYPGSSIGKAYLNMGGSIYVCSASIAAHNMVWTAGHCVFGPGYFGTGHSSDFCFVPGFYNNQKAIGHRGISYCYPSRWGAGILQGYMEYDFALVQVGNNSFQPGTEFDCLDNNENNWNSNNYQSNGYPAAGKFNGNLINVCTSTGCERDPNQSLKNTVGINCDSTGGCSGGPWIVLDRPTGRYKIAGVNSYGYSNYPNVLYSPCFDGEVPTFRELVGKCGPTSC